MSPKSTPTHKKQNNNTCYQQKSYCLKHTQNPYVLGDEKGGFLFRYPVRAGPSPSLGLRGKPYSKIPLTHSGRSPSEERKIRLFDDCAPQEYRTAGT